MKVLIRPVLLLSAVGLIQSAWLVRLQVAGQTADPLLPLVIVAAFQRPAWAPLFGVAAGFLQDLLFGGSLGLFALPKLVIGQAAGLLALTVLIDHPLMPWLTVVAATIAQRILVVTVLALNGLLPPGGANLGIPLLAQVGLNLLVAGPVFGITRLVLPRPVPPRRRVRAARTPEPEGDDAA